MHRGQCKKYALKGTHYCSAHTRRIKVFSVASKNIYALRASKKLQSLVEEIEKNPDERMQLAQEIDMARAFSVEAISTAAAVMESSTIGIESKMTAIKLAHESLAEVSLLVEKHTKICALTDGLLTPSQVDAVVKQVAAIVEANVSDETTRQKILDQLADVIVPKRASNIQINVL